MQYVKEQDTSKKLMDEFENEEEKQERQSKAKREKKIRNKINKLAKKEGITVEEAKERFTNQPDSDDEEEKVAETPGKTPGGKKATPGGNKPTPGGANAGGATAGGATAGGPGMGSNEAENPATKARKMYQKAKDQYELITE